VNVRLFQVEVFWVMTPRSEVVGYQRYRGLWYSTPTLHGITTQNTSS